MKIFYVVTFLFLAKPAFSQEWYNQLKSEHKRSRFGMGINGADPLGLSFEIFKGDFCSNGNGYLASSVWILNFGVENVLEMPDLIDGSINYANQGPVKIGGMRAEFGVQIKLFSIILKKMTIQMHTGPAIEGGTRNYYLLTDNQNVSTTDFAANGHLRLSFMPSGIAVGNGLMFISFHGGLKYQYVLTEEYSYLRPTFGISFRKVR